MAPDMSPNTPSYTYLKKPSSASQGNKASSSASVATLVSNVIDDVRARGDAAVRAYSQKFDRWDPPTGYKLSAAQIDAAIAACPAQLIDDVKTVQANVRKFAQAQRESLRDFEMETQPGVWLGQKNVPVESVGAYVPGGRYPLLASAHMTIVTARVAGVKNVVGATPPIAGEVPNATVAAMHLAGADEIYLLGGVQAIAAMAIGTETIKKVDFLAGPGNAFVAEAKRQLFGSVGIDLFAGPTEILIVADDAASPHTVAVDILSQAEHGPDSPAVIITTSEAVGRRAVQLIDELLANLPTAELAGASWRDWGECVVVPTLDDAWRLADRYASEHVQILTENPRQALHEMRNYGALFLGDMTCVSYGDKVIGTNHVLPTRGASRYTGGLWVGKYLKTVTYQEVVDPRASGELGRLCGRAARAERFEGHARSGDLRAQKYLGDEFEWIKQSEREAEKQSNGA